MRKILLSTAMLITLFSACKKDDQPVEAPAEVPEVKLFNMLDGGSTKEYSLLSYDTGRGQINYFILNTFLRLSPGYDENGRLATMNSNTVADPSIMQRTGTFSYDASNRLVIINQVSPTSWLRVSYDSLAYNSNGTLAAIYHSEGTDAFDSKEGLVWDSEGNLVARYVLPISGGATTNDTISSTTYTYDEAKNFMGKPADLFMFNLKEGLSWLSVNNPLTQVTSYPSGDSIVTVTNAYTYDASNYPATMDRVRKATQSGMALYNDSAHYTIRYLVPEQ
jgi:hypothetical protein